MQLLLEFAPLLAFFAAYKLGGIYIATATIMVAMVLGLLLSWFRTRRISIMQGASTALVLVFGATTLVLRDVRFIQWKPSIFLWLMAAAFLVSFFVGKQPLAQRVLQPAFGDLDVDRRDWLKINAAWVVFGTVTGFANIYFAYNASEATWANVKVFGLPGAMFVFLLAQALWLHSRAKPAP